MSETKHTPGPWTRDIYGNVIAANNSTVGTAWGTPDRNYPEGKPVIANSHLMAAAPDLLGVVKVYEQWEADVILTADWQNATPRLSQAQWDRLVEIQGMRNAAIAKATGAAP